MNFLIFGEFLRWPGCSGGQLASRLRYIHEECGNKYLATETGGDRQLRY